MQKVTAYTADGNRDQIFRTARSARENEFDKLIFKIFANISTKAQSDFRIFALDLRTGSHPLGIVAFLAAADYLREHRAVLTGAEKDPEEVADVE